MDVYAYKMRRLMMGMGLGQRQEPRLYCTEIRVRSLRRDPASNHVDGLFPTKLVTVDKNTYKCVFHLPPTLSQEVMSEVLRLVSFSTIISIDYNMDGLIYRINDLKLVID